MNLSNIQKIYYYFQYVTPYSILLWFTTYSIVPNSIKYFWYIKEKNTSDFISIIIRFVDFMGKIERSRFIQESRSSKPDWLDEINSFLMKAWNVLLQTQCSETLP